MAIATNDISAFAAVINGVNLPLLLLGGVLLPMSTSPEWMLVLAHFDPLYYLVVASRDLAHDAFGLPEVWQAFAVLVPLCALMLAWPTRIFRKAVPSPAMATASGAGLEPHGRAFTRAWVPSLPSPRPPRGRSVSASQQR